jgi:hypothetical protein
MTYEEIVQAWNADADAANSWDNLSDPEKVEFAFTLGTKKNCQTLQHKVTRDGCIMNPALAKELDETHFKELEGQRVAALENALRKYIRAGSGEGTHFVNQKLALRTALELLEE